MTHTHGSQRALRSAATVRASSLAVCVATAAMALAVIDCSGSTANTASAGTTGSAAGASFEVRMHRPATVGRRGRVVSAAVKHQHMQVRASGQVVRDTREDLSVHFRANERVVSIDSHGKPLGSEYTIEQLESDGANAVEVLIPPGQIVTVTRAPRASQAQLLIDGQPVSSPVRAALDAVLALAVGAATDDQIFGTPERQAAGARWPLHGDIAARDLAAASDIQATIAGETRVVQRTMFQATDCLEMHGEMNATVHTLPNLPPGAVIRVGTLTVGLHGMFPLVTSMPALSSGTRLSMHIVVDFQAQGQAGELEMTAEDQRDETYTPL